MSLGSFVGVSCCKFLRKLHVVVLREYDENKLVTAIYHEHWLRTNQLRVHPLWPASTIANTPNKTRLNPKRKIPQDVWTMDQLTISRKKKFITIAKYTLACTPCHYQTTEFISGGPQAATLATGAVLSQSPITVPSWSRIITHSRCLLNYNNSIACPEHQHDTLIRKEPIPQASRFTSRGFLIVKLRHTSSLYNIICILTILSYRKKVE